MDVQYDVVIIGGGPAGMTAAIYASRAGLKVAMLEKEAPGGKLIKTFEIQNYPSIKEMNGADLAYQMFEHSTHFGAEYLYGDVVKVEKKDNEFITHCADGSSYTSHAVLVATGTQERLLQIPKEKELTGKGVSYCAVCDGAFFKNQVVTVIGGGNSALEEALYLTQFASQVNVVIRRDVFRAEPIIQDKIMNEPKINFIKKHVPVEIIEQDGKVGAIVLESVDTKERMTVDTKAVFPYIGADPITAFLADMNVVDKQGYVLVDDHMATSVPGLYASGDCISKVLRQVITACGDGAVAAQSIFHYIKG